SIQCLRTRKEQLLRELEEVSLEINLQNAKYSRFLNDDAPVYRLPNEILTHIFILVQGHFSNPLLHVKASHVSHRWRSIFLSTPLLWNTISFHIRPAKKSFSRLLPLLDAQLLHSAQCILDIDLHFYDTDTDLAPYLSRLAAHATRWRRLSIAIHDPHPHMDAFKELLSTAQAPVLEHLSLTLGDPFIEEKTRSPRMAYPSMDGTILAPGAPALSFVRLAGHAMGRMHPPLQAVTTLHLDGWTRHYITPDQLTGVLGAAPRLVNLSLNQFAMSHPRDPTVFPRAVALPHLRRLRLRGLFPSPARFCALIDAPGLYALTLTQIDAFQVPSLPSVRHVTLDVQSGFDEADITQLARATPGVLVLTAEVTFREIFIGLLPGDGPAAAAARPWPALRALELWDMEIGDVPYLCHLVFTLQEIGALSKDGDGDGLSKISLDRRGRTGMRAKHRLDWLEERVEVGRAGEQERWPLGLGYTDPH
ncbi:hypothetical protein HYPSUDRAFT_119805, partial [Hypholoma sublateritium FD-334 SS-4]